MYCHTHNCHYRHCKCVPKDSKENGKALTQEELLALTQEMKQELKDYTVDLKDQIFSYIDIGVNPVEIANTFASLKEQDTYILRTLTNKIDELNNTTNLSIYNLRTRVTNLEGQGATTNVELNKVKLDTGITATAKFGGVERELSEKLKDTVSVKDFGAVGDGVTDDTQALKNALLSGAKNIYVPEGVYCISETLKIPKNVKLNGAGIGYFYNHPVTFLFMGAGAKNYIMNGVTDTVIKQ